ncbi:hypothetical protein LSCM1_06733 [Leishmania martiniquensis]|uniref:Uncharacterized protein n=1 Tax=Leishmania martiniquensis TaxID=1580590 RepID=A0A836KPU7_9TRYP|nr:hypothetical protein LSCM1_06733 [Leishmania martiniquensis]
MQRLLSLAAKVSGAVVVCLLAYRGAQLYSKNEIHIYITEVVHLPTTAAQDRQQPSPQRSAALRLIVEGTVEMETCVMNSYRFLLKLAGHVRSSLFDAKLSEPSLRSSRRRVLSMHASNAAVDSPYSTPLSDTCGFPMSSNNNSSSGGGIRRHGPSLVITSVDHIVDAYEADATGALAFTPACVGDGVLCRFTCVASASVLEGGGSGGIGSVFVRSCFFESDGVTPYGQRLTMEVEFARPVYGARVLIRLPNRHCRLHHSSTGGVGSVTQLLHQPRKCVWDIGAVSEEMCAVSEDGTAALGAAEGFMEGNQMPGAVAPTASFSPPTKSLAKLELVYEQAPPALNFGEEDAETEPTDSGDDMDNRFSSAVSSTGNTGGGSSHRCCHQSLSGRSSSSARGRMSSAGKTVAASAANTTSRARKREERARKAIDKAARIQEGGGRSSTRAAGDEDVPTVELVFSVNELLSGTSVKKLQVVAERPNWAPRSRLDHLFRCVVPGLEKLKLKKYAHYTTWFVQPVAVSRL